MTVNIFKLEPRMLKACAPVMDTSDVRYYLCGVNIICVDGVITYRATNGHVLVKIESEMEQECDDFNIIVHRSMVKNITDPKFLKSIGVVGEEYVNAVIDGLRIQVEGVDGFYNQKLVDGTFPDVDNAIPKNASFVGKEFESMGFNISYIKDLASSLKSFSGHYTAEFAVVDQHSPSLFNARTDHGKWTGVLMPVRI